MDLSALAAQTASIPTPSGNLAVRGLGLSDISRLVQNYRSDLEGAFEKVSQAAESAVEDDGFIAGLLEQAPDLVAEIIALATDQPHKAKDAAKLPLSLQVAILEKAGELTFVGEGGVGKTLEIVINMIGGATQVADQLTQNQED